MCERNMDTYQNSLSKYEMGKIILKNCTDANRGIVALLESKLRLDAISPEMYEQYENQMLKVAQRAGEKGQRLADLIFDSSFRGDADANIFYKLADDIIDDTKNIIRYGKEYVSIFLEGVEKDIAIQKVEEKHLSLFVA